MMKQEECKLDVREVEIEEYGESGAEKEKKEENDLWEIQNISSVTV